MNTEIYPWQQGFWQQLCKQIPHLAHSILLTGMAGTGTERLAQALAAVLLCQETMSEQLPCEHCRACRLLHAGTHPDYWMLDDAQNNMSIDDVRQLKHWLTQTSQLAGAKVIVIKHIEHLHIMAANALLKILEEPPANNYFILTTANQHQVLPTIRSRCQVWLPPMPTPSQVTNWLINQGIAEQDSILLCRLSDNAPSLALSLAPFIAIFKQFYLALTQATHPKARVALLSYLEQIEQPSWLMRGILQWWIDIIRLKLYRQEQVEITYPELNSQLQINWVTPINCLTLFGYYDTLLQANDEIKQHPNINISLWWENIVFSLPELAH
ncbi:MAG: hypothetical protein Tsb005_09580 [Gammaproteobacteria bacterium]